LIHFYKRFVCFNQKMQLVGSRFNDTHTPDVCDDPLYLPTTHQFVEALGGWSYVLYTVGVLNTGILALLLGILVKQLVETIPAQRVVSTVWVTSIYLVISSFNLIGLFLPRSADFLWLVYKMFVGISMGHFVDLTLGWYGGETAMLQNVGEETPLSFRKAPCCCCLFLPKSAFLTKNKIRLMRGSVYQIPYTESLCLILLLSLQISGLESEGGFSLAAPSMYITILLSLSFFFGIWGLFMFFGITQKLNLLGNFNFKKKSNLMRITIVIINFQSMLIDVSNRLGWIACIPDQLSASGVAFLIKTVCILIESIVLGAVSFFIYKDEGTYM